MNESLWRELLHKEIRAVALSGTVLDLGGSRNSRYHALFGGTHTVEVVNLEAGEGVDHAFDLEEPFPLPDAAYDHVVCFNVLEHIFNYQNVLNESHRVLKENGTAIFAVPFVMQVHPSPRDHWRYTKATLERIFKTAGFRHIEITTVGTGVFGAANLLKNHLYRPRVIGYVCKRAAQATDALIQKVKPNNKFSKEHFPLGYIVYARK